MFCWNESDVFVLTMYREHADEEMSTIVKTFYTFDLNAAQDKCHDRACVHVLRCNQGAAVWACIETFSKANEQKHSIFYSIALSWHHLHCG